MYMLFVCSCNTDRISRENSFGVCKAESGDYCQMGILVKVHTKLGPCFVALYRFELELVLSLTQQQWRSHVPVASVLCPTPPSAGLVGERWGFDNERVLFKTG